MEGFDSYLGFPVINGRVRNIHFDFICQKMSAKLSCWKRRLLNKAGIVNLSRSVLMAIPNYYMQHMWIPQAVCDQIDRIARNFIWKNEEGIGLNLVSWDKVARPRSMGGLGIRKARDSNLAFLGKLVNCFSSPGRLPPWAALLSNLYGCARLIFPSTSNYASPTYRAVLKAAAVFIPGFRMRVGDGRSNFWTNPWLEKGSSGPRIPFIHISDSHLRIMDVFQDGNWRLNSLYTQLPQDIKEEIHNFGPLVCHPQLEDMWCWRDSCNRGYSVKLGYIFLIKRAAIEDSGWLWVWKLKVPEKVRLLVWLIMRDSLPTNLLRFNRNLTNDPSCPICGNVEESW